MITYKYNFNYISVDITKIYCAGNLLGQRHFEVGAVHSKI